MNGLLGDAARGLVRGATADFAGAPVDTLNAIRSGLLGPAQAGNPYAAALGGLLGPVQQVGSGDWIAQQMGLPQGSGMVYETARMLAPSPTEMLNLARRVPLQELITYHGTPHRFEPTPENPLGEFRASQIGTGEGAQAYGHGIYVAENPGVASDYRYSLSARRPDRVTLDGKPVSMDTIKGRAIEKMGLVGKQSALQSIDDNIRFNEKYAPDMADLYRQVRKEIEEIDPLSVNVNRGNLYTADLPDEMVDRMLDWDKPFLEQSDEIKKFAKANFPAAVYNQLLMQRSGDMVEELAKYKGGKAKASELMREAGIPGIKYLDAGSRGDKAKPTRNFVIFPGEEKKVKILKRE